MSITTVNPKGHLHRMPLESTLGNGGAHFVGRGALRWSTTPDTILPESAHVLLSAPSWIFIRVIRVIRG
jgi:hypothetical protein